MFDQRLIDSIENEFKEAVAYFGDYQKEIRERINTLTGDELHCTKFVYANLPLSDISDNSFDMILSYVRHSLFVREKMPWGKTVPVDVFLSDVLFPRINTEQLDGCREILYNLTAERVAGLSMYDAVIEVNYWCLENATYRTTDMRTSPPLTVLKRAYGRCGEESTLTVNVLRSLCIPARQVYTPRWAHCDSNHAWSEAWCDGKWHYLGACEPEPVLDRGWFDSAATRAMLLHSRTFYKNTADQFKITDEGPIATINRLPDYGICKPTKVTVSENGIKLKDVKVVFEIINFGAFSPISTLYTDENGSVELISGIGSLIVRAIYKGKFVEKLVHTGETNFVEIDMKEGRFGCTDTCEFEMQAPINGERAGQVISRELKDSHKKRSAVCTEMRRKKEEEFIVTSEQLKNFRPWYDKEVLDNILFQAKGNAGNVIAFLEKNESPYAYELLLTLNEKDYTDLDPEILHSHLENALVYSENYEKDIFVKYILCPRILFENITDFRSFIQQYFDEEQKGQFRKNPALVYEYIKENIEFCMDKEYDSLYTSPEGALRLKKASPQSQYILFTAICRSFGIPARLNPETRDIEYLDSEGAFISPVTKEPSNARLNIICDESINWSYRTNWSLSILENGEYQPLWLNCTPAEVSNIALKAGFYRIMTANRLPNGNIYGKYYGFELKDYEPKTIEMELRSFELRDMLININLNEFNVYDINGNEKGIQGLLQDKNILIWLEENEEPTEHILNELADAYEEYNKTEAGLFFVMREANCLKNRNIARVQSLIPKILPVIDPGFDLHEPIARNLYADPEKLPLAVVLDRELKATYVSAGYNVGLGDLLLRIAGL